MTSLKCLLNHRPPGLALRGRPLQLVPLLDVLLAELLDLVPVLLAGAPREHETAHHGGAQDSVCKRDVCQFSAAEIWHM